MGREDAGATRALDRTAVGCGAGGAWGWVMSGRVARGCDGIGGRIAAMEAEGVSTASAGAATFRARRRRWPPSSR